MSHQGLLSGEWRGSLRKGVTKNVLSIHVSDHYITLIWVLMIGKFIQLDWKIKISFHCQLNRNNDRIYSNNLVT